MATFNPEDHKEAGTSKSFDPGQIFGTIANITLESPSWDKKGGTYVHVTIQGPDLGEGFEGFQIDKQDPGLGNYVGKIANVKSGNFTFSDFTTKAGKFIGRDDQVEQFLGDLLLQMGKKDAAIAEYKTLLAAGNAPSTIEEYAEMVKNVLVDPENFGQFTVLGEPYTNKTGGTSYGLQFPKKEGKKYPFAASPSEDVTPPSLLVPTTYFIEPFVKTGEGAQPSAEPAQSEVVAGFGGQVAQVATAQPAGRQEPALDELPF